MAAVGVRVDARKSTNNVMIRGRERCTFASFENVFAIYKYVI